MLSYEVNNFLVEAFSSEKAKNYFQILTETFGNDLNMEITETFVFYVKKLNLIAKVKKYLNLLKQKDEQIVSFVQQNYKQNQSQVFNFLKNVLGIERAKKVLSNFD